MSGAVIEYHVEVMSHTRDALYCAKDASQDPEEFAWIPRSLCEDGTEVVETGDEGMIAIPEWKAIEIGWE